MLRAAKLSVAAAGPQGPPVLEPADLDRRWRRARGTALGVPGSGSRADSRADTSTAPSETATLAALAEAPAERRELAWSEATGSAVNFERLRFVCDAYREAIDGLVCGLGDGVRFARRSSSPPAAPSRSSSPAPPPASPRPSRGGGRPRGRKWASGGASRPGARGLGTHGIEVTAAAGASAGRRARCAGRGSRRRPPSSPRSQTVRCSECVRGTNEVRGCPDGHRFSGDT